MLLSSSVHRDKSCLHISFGNCKAVFDSGPKESNNVKRKKDLNCHIFICLFLFSQIFEY